MTGKDRHLLYTELKEPIKVSSPESPESGRTYRRYVDQPHNQGKVTVIEPFKSVSPPVSAADGSNELSYLMPSELEESEKQSNVLTGSLLKGFSYDKLSEVVKTDKNYEVVCSVITEYSYKEAKTVHSLEDTRTYYDGYNIK